MSQLSSVPERNRDRRPRERLAGSTGWERAGDRTVTVKHFCLMEELALEISTATTEDGLFEALERASMRLGFDHFALASDRPGNADPASLLVHHYPAAWDQVYVGFVFCGAALVRP